MSSVDAKGMPDVSTHLLLLGAAEYTVGTTNDLLLIL